MDLALDVLQSSVLIHTHAIGALSKFAHDLELHFSPSAGKATLLDNTLSAEATFLVRNVTVNGALRNGRVEPRVLGASDRQEILKRLGEKVFRGAAEIRAAVRGTKDGHGTLRLSLGGKECSEPITFGLRIEGETYAAEGVVPLYLSRLEIPEVRGPLNAFRVDDKVSARFSFYFTAPEGA